MRQSGQESPEPKFVFFMIVSKENGVDRKALIQAFPWIGKCLEWAASAPAWSEENEAVTEGIYVKKVAYETHDPSECRFENHRKELDLQLIIEGGEVIELLAPALVEKDEGYQVDGDVEFYHSSDAVATRLPLKAGDFAVFFPDDVHCCGWTREGVATVRKYVFKIDREHWNLV